MKRTWCCAGLIAIVGMLVHTSFASINFKHCLGPADLGPNPAKGIYPNVCIKDHHFENETHSWFFGRSTIKNTNFTACTFEKEGPQSFWRSNWENVRFYKCKFRKSEEMTFTETSLRTVVFDNCIFAESATVIFSRFSFSNVEFRNCTFLSEVLFTLGTIQRSAITQSRLGSTKAKSSGEGNVLFSEITIQGFTVQDSLSWAEIRFQEAQLSDLQIYDSQLHNLWCHEEVISGRKVKKASSFNDTVFERVAFSDGFYCDHSSILRAELRNVSVRNSFSLASSTIEAFVLSNLTSLDDTCSIFDLSEATVDGGRLELLATTKGTFAGTEFKSYIALPGFVLSKSQYNLEKTVFASERINDECCTEACVKQKCLCNVPTDPIFCPRGDSSVNINLRDSCFPADATVHVIQNYNDVKLIRMENLRYGDAVLAGDLNRPSTVFFYGHKSHDEHAIYQVITVNGKEGETVLTVSGGHMIPTVDRGTLPADQVIPGDLLLDTAGRAANVTNVHRESRRGIFAPTTFTGVIVVNGIQTSCYTDILPIASAHSALTPLRAGYKLGKWGRWLVEQVRILYIWSPAPIIRQGRELSFSSVFKAFLFTK